MSTRLIVALSVLFGVTMLPVAASKQFHKSPFDFLFGNHIDTHQETRLTLTKDGEPESLKGWLYIMFTGGVDPVSNLPLARHPRGAAHDEECGVDPIECVNGWTIRGLPGQAKFVSHDGVNGHDHPLWLLNRVDIPQPGSYLHFHWITDTSNQDPRAAASPEFCNQQTGGQLEATGAADWTCAGWFLELEAVRDFAFQHGGETIPVRVGVDNASHLNLLTNYGIVPQITATR